jgi:Response regulator containing CheY-like receiver domain and AraC-type DNA-binding domain
MKVLLVDDDKYVIEGMSLGIDWQGLGITDLFISYDIVKAKQILKANPIDIMICDIEMPLGSGLDLLEWVRNEKMETKNIFLTSYADFDYAQKAISLGSFDYFLKPIDYKKLTNIIHKAIEKVKQGDEDKEYKQLGKYWVENREDIKDAFWKKILESQKNYENDIDLLVEKYGFNYDKNSYFGIVLVKFLYPKRDSNKIDIEQMKENFEHMKPEPIVIETILEEKEDTFLAVIKYTEPKECQELYYCCSEWLIEYIRNERTEMCFYISSPCHITELSYQKQRVMMISGDNVSEFNKVFLCDKYEEKQIDYTSPDLSHLELLLKNCDSKEAIEEIESYLVELKKRKKVNAVILGLFRLEFTQLIFGVLKDKNIQANQLFSGKEEMNLYEESLKSIESMKKYIKYFINRTVEYSIFIEQSQTIIEKIKEYIKANLDKDITRNYLGELLYMHPNSVVRLFKQETGMTLGNYILKQRIELAKDLLSSTNMPINVISVKVGYTNFSYFTKLFKEYTDYTPKEYRKHEVSSEEK